MKSTVTAAATATATATASQQVSRAPGTARPRSVFLIVWLFFSVLATLWSLASPIFSVPDENAHATKAIAQMQGQILGYTVPGIKYTVVDLPPGNEYPNEIVCFTFRPNQPADCGAELGDAGGTDWFNTWVGAYNPGYYFLTGWPSLFLDGSAAVYGMRIVSGMLAAVFVAWSFQAALSVRKARWMPLGLSFLAAPMVLFLSGAVNPNGLEVTAAAALWVSLLRLLQRTNNPDPGTVSDLSRRYLWLIVTVSAVMLAIARATGPLWLIVVVVVCFIAVGWQPVKQLFTTAGSYVGLGIVAAGGLWSIGWTLSGGSLSGQADVSDTPLVGGEFYQGFAYMFRMLPIYLQQSVGIFGWLDTPLPVFVYWLIVAPLSILLAVAWAGVNRRSVITLAVVSGAALFVPALVQGYSVSQTGIIWQGRYGLFLYIGVTIVAAWVLSGRAGHRVAFMSARLTWISLALLGLYGLSAFLLVLRRYVVGNGAFVNTMWTDPAWQPPLGWPVLVALYAVVSAAFFCWMGLMATRAARVDDDRDGVDGAELLPETAPATRESRSGAIRD